MLSGWLIALLASAYVGLLFAVARFGDARADAGKSIISANVYALSLAVYCTSWTFYGSVGRASTGGLSFLTIYIGPTLMLLCVGVIIKMIRISKAQRITSIADFIASRYGKSQLLAGLVTVIAVIGVVPYIALQLKAVAASLDVLFAQSGATLLPWWLDSTFLIAAVLALFAILFGTRHLDATERHEGMVAAVAFESVVKLVAFLAVGLFVTYGMFGGFSDLFRQAAASPELAHLLQLDSARAGTWAALILLSGLAIIFLPRQFQIIVVENVDEAHLKRAVWLFPLYLLLINIFVLPLALGGLLHFQGQVFNPDTFVLTLPMARGAEALALLVFVRYGGDVIVEAPPTGSRVVATVPLGPMRVTMGAKHADVVHDSGFLLSKDGRTLMQPDPWAGALVVAADREKLADHQRIVLGGETAGRVPGDPTGLLTHACTRAWSATASITDDTPDDVVTAFKGAIEDHLLTALVLAWHSDAAEAATMTPGRVEELRQWLELNHGIEITTAAMEQSNGISQVNVAVTQLDQMTQQNAALVEESTAAATCNSQIFYDTSRICNKRRSSHRTKCMNGISTRLDN